MVMCIPTRGRQRGAVAVIVGLLSVLVLFGMMGIAVDLSYLYARKTELQNGADAAALAGAKQLNETAAGVTNAVTQAVATFGQNSGGNLINGESISIADIRLGGCPNPSDRLPLRTPNCTFVAASSVTSNALASGLTFLEVNTGNAASKPVFFMPVLGGASSADTFGYAVAGRFVNHITPIGVCAIVPYPGGVGNPDTRTSKYTYPDTTTELVELGFRRGISYNIIALNPLGASGTPFLINPVDAPPGGCDPNHSSANFTAPFVCQGNSAVGSGVGASTQVFVNTGFSAGPMEKALNSRFDTFGGGSPCDPATAPPDANIKSYTYSSNAAGEPRAWTQPGSNTLPAQQSVILNNHIPVYSQPNAQPGATFTNYGALWSYSRAYQADASSPPKAGSAFAATDANWGKLYNNGPGGSLLDPSYPGSVGSGFPGSYTAAPYNQFTYSPLSGSSAYYQAPTHAGKVGRRVLNIVILDCSSLGGGGLSCAPMTVRGIGKFFMQVPANLTGSTKTIDAEFAGLIDPVPTADVKLYR